MKTQISESTEQNEQLLSSAADGIELQAVDSLTDVTLDVEKDDTTDKASAQTSKKLQSCGYIQGKVSKVQSWTITLVYFGVYFTMGMVIAAPGPTLPRLMQLTKTKEAEIGLVFIGRSIGAVIGSVTGGPLVDRLPGNPASAVVMLATGVSFMLVPAASWLWLLMMLMSVQGFSMGFADCACNTLLVRLHGENVDSYMQALHCCFGLGAVVCPLVVRGVIAVMSAGRVGHGTNVTLADTPLVDTPMANVTLRNGTECVHDLVSGGGEVVGDVFPAFWIIGSLSLILGILLFTQGTPPSRDASATKSQNFLDMLKNLKCSALAGLVACSAIILGVYVGVEVTFGGYVTNYAISCEGPLRLSEAKGQYMNSVFWGALAVGRVCAIPMSLKLSPAWMLAKDFVGCIIGALIGIVAMDSEYALWASNAVFGFFMASIFPSVLNFVAQTVELTGFIASVCVIGASLGEMTIPSVAGVLFALEPRLFLPLALVLSVIQGAVFIGLKLFGNRIESTRNDGDGDDAATKLVEAGDGPS